MRNGIVRFFAGAEEIKDSTLGHMAPPASKAFNKSHPRRLHCLHHLMSLTLPLRNQDRTAAKQLASLSRAGVASLTLLATSNCVLSAN